MNRRKHQVAAFTLMELTISMLVTALVIGIAYSSYAIISRSYLQFQSKNVEMGALLRLDEWLRKDIVHADTILKEAGGFTCRSAQGLIRYEVAPDFIIRISSRSDTFRVKTSALTTLFEQQAITDISPQTELNRIDELSFHILYQNELIPYHYHKHYSSVNLINRNTDAVN